MKKSQKDTTAMDVESDPGIPHAQMSSPTRVARTALSATMIPTKRFTEAWMRRTIFERSRARSAGRGDEEEHVKEADGGIPEVVEEIVGELRPERLVFERELHLVLEGVPAGEGEVVLLQEAEGDAVREVGEVVDPRDGSVVPFLLIPVLVDPLLAEVEGPYEGAGDEHDEGDGDGKGDQPGDDHRAGIPRRGGRSTRGLCLWKRASDAKSTKGRRMGRDPRRTPAGGGGRRGARGTNTGSTRRATRRAGGAGYRAPPRCGARTDGPHPHLARRFSTESTRGPLGSRSDVVGSSVILRAAARVLTQDATNASLQSPTEVRRTRGEWRPERPRW